MEQEDGGVPGGRNVGTAPPVTMLVHSAMYLVRRDKKGDTW